MFAIYVEVHLAAEDHGAVRQLRLWLDEHADDANFAITDPQVLDRIAAAEPVEDFPVHGKRGNGDERRARVRAAARSRRPQPAQAAAASRGVDAKEEREAISVE